MITKELILTNGYKEWKVPVTSHATKTWYKLFYNSEGKHIYQICIYYYTYENKYSTFEGEVCFTYPNDKVGWFTFKANTVEEIENFFANLFTCTGALPYDN
jgi:hypothetical protein